jgi:hypothetical protein
MVSFFSPPGGSSLKEGVPFSSDGRLWELTGKRAGGRPPLPYRREGEVGLAKAAADGGVFF